MEFIDLDVIKDRLQKIYELNTLLEGLALGLTIETTDGDTLCMQEFENPTTGEVKSYVCIRIKRYRQLLGNSQQIDPLIVPLDNNLRELLYLYQRIPPEDIPKFKMDIALNKEKRKL